MLYCERLSQGRIVGEITYLLRLVHTVAGLGWLGEVITINFVLLPALSKASQKDRLTLLHLVFPYIFRLATVLGGLTIASGFALMLWMTQLNMLLLVQTTWGQRVLLGGIVGGLLYFFHLFQESGAEGSLAARLAFSAPDDPKAAERLLKRLALFPRMGMLVLLVVIALMSAASRLP